jgi:hypothetical protein
MPYFNGRTYFLSAVYHTRGGFSHLPRFLGMMTRHFNTLPYECAPVLEKVRQLRQEYTCVSGSIGEEEALKLMIGNDLWAIEQVLSDEKIVAAIEQRQNIEHVLQRCRDKAIDQLQSMGVRIETPEIVFVDELPPPYNQRGYSAFSADRGDSEKYNMRPGIYFPIKRLRPFYSEFLLFHELIHFALGKSDPYLLARGLEEGLAELLGSMYLSSKILGDALTINLFIYNRLSSDYQRFWELYMDATRQATLLHQRFGLQGLFTLLNRGRRGLKQVEDCCLQMDFKKIDLPRGGEVDPELTDITDFLSLAFSRNLVVSPLAKYLSGYVHAGYTLSQVMREAQVDESAGMNALLELENKVSLASYSYEGDEPGTAIINWTDCDRVSIGSTIRYDIPTAKRT